MIHHGCRLLIGKYGLTIFVFGDLQFGAEGFDEEAWQEFRHEFKNTPNAWGLGLGDYGDFIRPSLRGKLYGSLSGDDSARQQLDNQYLKLNDTILNKMDFLEGKLVGLHTGHHEYEFLSGGNGTQRFASALRAPYLGWMASTRLSIVEEKALRHGQNRGRSYTIISMHGTGNGRTVSADARWLENNIVPGWVADHYIKGHSCKSATWIPSIRNHVRRCGPFGVDIQTPLCMNVGGFHRGYTDGWNASYVEKFGFLPQAVSWGKISIRTTQRKSLLEKKGVRISNKPSIVLDVEQCSRTVARSSES